jgi:sugar/nucleoside kinase (ribokinase family)
MKKFDVLVIGELNVDLILNQIDAFPAIGKERLAGNMDLVLGSSSAIFACNLSVLGPRVAFLGKIGNDEFGKLVIDSLESKKVSTEFIISSERYKTGATIVLNYGEDRAMITHPGAMEHFTFSEIKPDILDQCNHIHISSVFLQPGIKEKLADLLLIAKERNITTSLDTQWDPSEKWDLDLETVLPLVDVFLPNIQELLALTRQENLEKAIEYVKDYSGIIAVKMSNKGSAGIIKGKIYQSKPFLNNQVVDAIGAGDSFNAGFIFKFLQQSELNECLIFGNLMGAINTTVPGGTAAFHHFENVSEIARKRFNTSIDK